MNSQLLPDALLAQVSKIISSRLGLHFPAGRRQNLEHGLKEAAADLGFARTADYAEWLISANLTPAQFQTLADHLTIGETYFFRENYGLDILKDKIIPALISKRARRKPSLRLWSAGCSTGEEAYSLAILLDKYFPQLKDGQVTILATDINTRFLEKAQRAIYRQWSFRNTPEWVQRMYFSHTADGQFVLHPRVKNRVSFAHLNLAEQRYPSFANNTYNMDVILCRNVLIYFNRPTINRIIGRFVQTLAPTGRLLVGPSEAAFIAHPQLRPLPLGKGTVFQKETAAQPNQPKAPPRPVFQPAATPPPRPPKPATPVKPAAKTDILAEVASLLAQSAHQQAAMLLLNALKTEENSAPPKSTLLTLLAQVCANQGNLEQALTWIEEAILVDKLTPDHHYLRGTILQEQNRLNEARKAFKRALFLDPDFVPAHFALGNLSRQNNEPGRANRHYQAARQALKQHPADKILPATGGLTVSELTHILQALL